MADVKLSNEKGGAFKGMNLASPGSDELKKLSSADRVTYLAAQLDLIGKGAHEITVHALDNIKSAMRASKPGDFKGSDKFFLDALNTILPYTKATAKTLQSPAWFAAVSIVSRSELLQNRKLVEECASHPDAISLEMALIVADNTANTAVEGVPTLAIQVVREIARLRADLVTEARKLIPQHKENPFGSEAAMRFLAVIK